jgi:hypothetical protein
MIWLYRANAGLAKRGRIGFPPLPEQLHRAEHTRVCRHLGSIIIADCRAPPSLELARRRLLAGMFPGYTSAALTQQLTAWSDQRRPSVR